VLVKALKRGGSAPPDTRPGGEASLLAPNIFQFFGHGFKGSMVYFVLPDCAARSVQQNDYSGQDHSREEEK